MPIRYVVLHCTEGEFSLWLQVLTNPPSISNQLLTLNLLKLILALQSAKSRLMMVKYS